MFNRGPKELFFLGLLATSFGLAGCDGGPSKKAVGTSGNPLLINANEAADFREVPESFTFRGEDIFGKPLKALDAGEPISGIKYSKVADSGIKFSNYLDRSKAFQHIETGSGVAIGDFDNDGLQDVYLSGTDIPNKLYRNLGGFKFEDVTFEAGVDGTIQNEVPWATSGTFADIDNDGDLDLYVCNMAAPNILYVNQGDGTFKEQTKLRGADYTGASKSANFCDYDRDGDLDFYLVTYQDRPSTVRNMVQQKDGKPYIAPEFLEHVALLEGRQIKAGELDRLFRNKGDGTFEEVSKEAGLTDYAMGLGCLWLDYDNDGWQDLYVSNDFKKPDRLYRNNGDGTFSDVLPETIRHTPWFSMGLDTGDINHDGMADLITVDMQGTSHYRQKVDMGSMGNSGWFLSQGTPRQYMKNAVHLNSGTGSFLESAGMMGLSSTGWTWSVRLVDMDNDGALDVYATNGHARDIMNADFDIEFDKLRKKGDVKEWDKMYLSIPVRNEANLAFRNVGDLQFKPVENDAGLSHVGVSHGASFGDLDNDGDLDLVVNNYYEPSLIYRNESNKGSRTMFEFRCQRNNFFGYGTQVELHQSGKVQTKVLSPVRGYASSDPAVLHFASESEATIEKLVVTWPDATIQEFDNLKPGFLYRILESESTAATGTPELTAPLFASAESRLGIDFKHQENEFNDYAREPLLPYQLSKLGAAVVWGDVNGDQWPDLFCGGAKDQPGELFINREGKKFEKQAGPWQKDAASEDMDLLFVDIDNDKDLDLIVTSGGTEFEIDAAEYRDRIYVNDGAGAFTKDESLLPLLSTNTGCVAAADFDNDGDIDLFFGSRSVPGKYPIVPESHLLRNDDGKFVVASEVLPDSKTEIGLVNDVVWMDYDGDGWQDLVVALDWGPVTVYRNEDGKRFADATEALALAPFKGWWHRVTAADLDGDGDMDLIASNQGLNTKYHADTDHPHRIYYDDFDKNGTLDLVESKFEGSVELPVRGRSCSANSMPFIEEKFKTYHDFAIASLTDIYEPSISDGPMVEVNSLESVVFWNEGGEKFLRRELPRLAQISPAFGSAVADFDQDGVMDIVLANNFYASQPETGYMDGGLSWFINGQMAVAESEEGIALNVRWPNESGIHVDGPAMGVAVADFDRDGDPDLAFAVNGGTVRVYENTATDESNRKTASK